MANCLPRWQVSRSIDPPLRVCQNIHRWHYFTRHTVITRHGLTKIKIQFFIYLLILDIWMRCVNCNCSYFMTIVSLGSGGTWSDCGFILVSWYSWLGGLCKQKQSLSSEFWQGWSAPSLHSWLSASKNDDPVVSYHSVSLSSIISLNADPWTNALHSIWDCIIKHQPVVCN